METEREQTPVTEPETETEDIESLRRENEELARQAADRAATIAGLEATIAARDAELAQLRETVDALETRAAATAEELATAVAAYREQVVAADPGVLPDLVAGDTIEAVDASLEKARALVERVRRELEEEEARTRVPAGAPPRAGIDVTGLSSREKIQYAIAASR